MQTYNNFGTSKFLHSIYFRRFALDTSTYGLGAIKAFTVEPVKSTVVIFPICLSKTKSHLTESINFTRD